MFKRLIDAVPEVKFELYSFKSTIKCKEMLEQDCWFENKVNFSFSSLEGIEVLKKMLKFKTGVLSCSLQSLFKYFNI